MTDRPNIITLVPHDVGRHLNCYGHSTVHSPNLDLLAQNGLLFEQAFCTAPQCSPSRASLVTGCYPHSNGVMGLTQGLFGWDMKPGVVNLPQVLQSAGYYTVQGSWQHFAQRTPEDNGFDAYAACQGNAETTAIKFGEWLKENRPGNQPLYAHFGLNEPHRGHFPSDFGHAADYEKGVEVPPWLVEEQSSLEEFASFQGGVRGLDRGVGKFVEVLREQGMLDNTILIFMADHGIPFPRAKCSLYDPGLEIALIMHWPEGIKNPGRRIKPMISNVDIFPTLLDLLGIDLPEQVEGRSYLPLLNDETYEPRQEIFGEMTYHAYCDPVRCIRTETHKLIANFTVAPSFMDSSNTWRPKTITKVPVDPESAFHSPIELYDLVNDPLEHRNLAGAVNLVSTPGGGKTVLSEDPKVQAIGDDMLERLYRWMRETEDPLLEGIPTPPRHAEMMKFMRGAGS